MKKKLYETPQTQHVEVEMEEGIMNKASVFEPDGKHDKGVTIQNHEFGETHDFTDDEWDNITL